MIRPTVDALLDAAEVEFAASGIETASLRKIMRDAGADPGAVHYHFGTREALATAVLERILVPLNARRLELLGAALAKSTPSAATLVDALIRPDVDAAHALNAESPGRARLIGAIYVRPSDFVAATVAAHFDPVARAFLPHLAGALPHLTSAEIAWRIRWCVFGTVGALLTDETAPFEQPPDKLTQALVRSLAGALAA